MTSFVKDKTSFSLASQSWVIVLSNTAEIHHYSLSVILMACGDFLRLKPNSNAVSCMWEERGADNSLFCPILAEDWALI